MTTTTATAPLTGAALIAHHEQYRGQNRSATVLAAGYRNNNGTPAFTRYYEAVLIAQGRLQPHAASAATDLARQHEISAANPEAWHGFSHGNAKPERFALVTVTDQAGQSIGASLPVFIADGCRGWSDDDTYSEAEQQINRHASTYADAAQGPDSFPLTVTLSDRCGPVTLFTIDADGTVEDHLGDGLSRCEHCDAIHNEDDGQTVQVRHSNRCGFNPEQWCSTCSDDHATRCDDCGDYYPNVEMRRESSGDDVCPDCVENHYFTCSDCGDLCHDDTHNTVDGCDSVCNSCIESGSGHRYYYDDNAGRWSTEPPESDDDDDDHQGPRNGFMRRYSYHTDANDQLGHDIPDTGHTYGAELEYKGNPTNWSAVADACHRRAILTNDSTVSGELVSVAASAGTIRRWLSATAAALAGTHNDTATGLHIHTDRRALTPWQWYTLSHYAATHASTLEAIAGRPSNQWSDLQSLPANNWPTFARSWKSRCWPTRYAGINFTKGPTVEWRICRATKTPARALARFGMIQRLTALGRLAPSQRPQSEEELRGWLAQDRNIQAVTGWKTGKYNYREAMQQPTVESDHQPIPPSAEQVKELRERVWRLEADRNLTDRLRYNAAWQYRTAINENQGEAYQRDARSRRDHYEIEFDRINRQVREARNQLDGLETLASLA